MSRPIRCAVFDCNDAVREALRRRLAADPRIAAVSVEGSPKETEVARIVQSMMPDAVLIDGHTGRGLRSTLAVLLCLRRTLPYFVIAAHVARQNDDEERALLASGCDLYLLKGLRTKQLIDRVYCEVERQRATRDHDGVLP